MKWEMVRLGEYTKIKTGKLDANASSEDGLYPFFTCSQTALKIDTYSYDCECVLVAGNGDLNVKYYNGKFDAYQRTYIIESINKNILNVRYLFYFLDKYVEKLRDLSIGGVIKYIKLGNLTDAMIPLPAIQIQHKIAQILDKAQNLLNKRNKQIELLDQFVRSTFIEMFGDPVSNPKGWDIRSIEEVCNTIVDCPHSTPKYTTEDTGFLCIRTSNIKRNEILWNDIEYISKEEYSFRVKRYEPKIDDIIYSRECAILGIAARIDRNEKIALGQRMMLLSADNLNCNPYFLCFSLNSVGVINQVNDKIGGSASPHINVGDIKKFTIIVPPKSSQDRFAEIMKKAEKQKWLLENGLEKLEINYKSLMQKAFNGELFQ